MDLKQLFLEARSYRRFKQNIKISTNELKEILALIRYTPSPMNMQPLKFILINNEETNEKIFEYLKWAAFLPDWNGPVEGEKPAAYIIILGETEKSKFIGWDYGIALQTLILGAMEKGIGACAIASSDKKQVRKVLEIDDKYELAAVVAFGKPAEKVVIDDMREEEYKYWRDNQDIHHVPKRTLDSLIERVIE